MYMYVGKFRITFILVFCKKILLETYMYVQFGEFPIHSCTLIEK
jgi:hypothetical protein